MHFVRLPSVAENIETLTLEKWLIENGQIVSYQDDIAEIITEKASFTLQLEEELSGAVLGLLAEERSVLPAGYIIAVIGDVSEQETACLEASQENRRLLSSLTADQEVPVKKISSPAAGQSVVHGDKFRAAPSARRAAKENGINLADVAAYFNITGIIKENDVNNYLEAEK